ncbi:hypothetical protein GCM10023204_44300 [Actinomycetospora succinea]
MTPRESSPWDVLEQPRRRPRDVRVAVLAVAAAIVLLCLALRVGEPSAVPPGGVVVAAAEDDADGSGGDDEQSDDEQSDDEQSDDQDADQGGGRGGGGDQEDDEEFPGRDQAGRAAANEYVDIQRVQRGAFTGEGGAFSGGSYTIRCAVSDHKNSDNYLITPGKRNGAQHTHDYAGNEGTNFASDEETLEETATTCTNGDRSPIFWPVLRDLRQQGPDVGVDGGSLDGNVGSLVEPTAVDFTFHGHGSRQTEALPLNIALVTGSAKAGTNDGEGANAKYTCTGAGGRLTDLYTMCPQGSALQRIYDFPSCWNGQDLDSEDHTTHIVYPDENGECDDDLVPVPALRITVSYADPPPGRQFAIDSFPEQQHDPITDHALLEYLSSERRAEEGAACINAARRCVQGPEQDGAASGSTASSDRVPRSQTFAHALATHATAHGKRAAAVARPGFAATARIPGADGPASLAPPATLPVPEASGVAADPTDALGPLPGLTRLPALAAPLRPGA